MNPLTLVKRIQNINSKEAALGISEDASWHAKYKESAYVFVGGIPFDLTEGDLLAVFAQYGEIVDVNLVRDKGTGKSKGFAFVAYEDQRSTNLAVDNLNGASVLGRIVRVDHVTNYKKKEEENEEEQQKKREARGVCRAFQKGECNRGAACKFSHNEQRCANTGWGAKDAEPKWKHDQHDVSSKSYRTSGNISDHIPDPQNHEQVPRFRSEEKDKRISRLEDNEQDSRRSFVRSGQERESTGKYSGRHEREADSKDWDRQGAKKRSDQEKTRQIPENDHELSWGERSARHSSEHNTKEVRDRREKKSERHDFETIPRKDHDGSREERSGKYNSERFSKDDRERRGGEKRSRYD